MSVNLEEIIRQEVVGILETLVDFERRKENNEEGLDVIVTSFITEVSKDERSSIALMLAINEIIRPSLKQLQLAEMVKMEEVPIELMSVFAKYVSMLIAVQLRTFKNKLDSGELERIFLSTLSNLH